MTDIEEKARLVACAINTLREHFDAVQILTTWTDGDNTNLINRGSGNYYARVGMAKEFLDKDQAITGANEIAEAMEHPDDGAGAVWLWKLLVVLFAARGICAM